MSTIGDRIRQVRGDVSQTDFGRKLGISQAIVSSIETDRTKPTWDLLTKMIQVYQVDVNWLLTGTGAASSVKEEVTGYQIDTDVARLARQLQEHPKLIPVVKSLVAVDDKLLRDAESLAGLLGVPIEIAALCIGLKQMKGA